MESLLFYFFSFILHISPEILRMYVHDVGFSASNSPWKFAIRLKLFVLLLHHSQFPIRVIDCIPVLIFPDTVYRM
jgi:hypothetical protein